MTEPLHGEADGPRSSAIPRLGFNPPGSPAAGIEIVDLATLRQRRQGKPETFHRVEFHTITLITGGAAEHTIDFVSHRCRPGTLLWARPGQVQRFDERASTSGTHLMFTPAFPPPFAAVDRVVSPWAGQDSWQLGSEQYATVSLHLRQLRAEYDHAEGASPDLMQLQLAVLLLLIDRLPRSSGQSEPRQVDDVFTRFRAELELSFARTRRVEDFARELGYSVRTLTRACLGATGLTAKQVIDARVVLEAKRLLAHTDDPVAGIARRLGFDEATNFGRFFMRTANTSPGEFRAAQMWR